jgi:hypothetical protein
LALAQHIEVIAMNRLLLGCLALVMLPGVVSAQAPPAAGACDRACLVGFIDQYLDALVAQDPTRLPVAPGVKFTENGQRLTLGDGFWNSVTGKGTYRIDVADAAAGQVGTFVTMREAPGTPLIMALRLKVENRRLTEIEVLLAHSEGGAKNLETIGKPRAAFLRETSPADRMSRTDLVRVANMYFSGMQKNDGKGQYPFAEDCDRLENGGQTTNAKSVPGRNGGPPRTTKLDPRTSSSYDAMWTCREQFESGLLHFVNRIRDRRYLVVDQERGLVLSFAFFDHPAGKTRTFQVPDGRTVTAGPQQPWTWEIAELFKVEKGLLHEIEAVLERSPYGMTSGWSSWDDAMSDKIQFAGPR